MTTNKRDTWFQRHPLLTVFLVFAILGVCGVLISPPDEPARATALTPCGSHQTPELAKACQREIERANKNYRERAITDYADKLNKSEYGQ